MSKKATPGKKAPAKKGNNKAWLIVGMSVLVVVIGLFAATSLGVTKDKTVDTSVSNGEVKILKKDVTSVAKFYPVEIDKTRMEVLAVRATDGSIRTALNTCQICYSSGRGYYKQEGDELVCQNCKNRFKVDQVEKIKGGCNPVPILKTNKTETDTHIIISKDFLVQNKGLFFNWKKL